MECRNHVEVVAADRCTACMEPFCANCLVTMKGQKYCGSCKVTALGPMPVFEATAEHSELANEAIKYAYIGIFCFGFILEPISLKKAFDARKMIEANPNLVGGGKVRAAFVIAPIVITIWVMRMLGRVRGM